MQCTNGRHKLYTNCEANYWIYRFLNVPDMNTKAYKGKCAFIKLSYLSNWSSRYF